MDTLKVRVVITYGAGCKAATLKAIATDDLLPNQLAGLVSRLYGISREQVAALNLHLDDESFHPHASPLTTELDRLSAAWQAAKVRRGGDELRIYTTNVAKCCIARRVS